MHTFTSWGNPGVAIKKGCLYTVLLNITRIDLTTASTKGAGLIKTVVSGDLASGKL